MKIKVLSFFLTLVCASWAVGQSDDFLQSIEEKREKLKPVMPLPSENSESSDAKKTMLEKATGGGKKGTESKTMKPVFALPVEEHSSSTTGGGAGKAKPENRPSSSPQSAPPVPKGVLAAYLNIFPNTDLAKIEVIAQGVGANGTSYWCIYAANKDVDGESGTDTEGAVELSPDGKGKMISAGHYASTPICYVKDKVALKQLQDSYAKTFLGWCGGKQNLLKENAGKTRAARMTYDLAAGLLRMGIPLSPETPVGEDGIAVNSLRPLKSYPELGKLLSEQK